MFYGRSSSATQESGLSAQIERAKALGIDEDHIFAELVSGKSKANRPKLAEMLRFARKWDTLVVTKLDRLGRSAADLHAIAQQLQKKGVNLRVLDQSIDTSTSAGRALFGMIAVFAEFERDLIEERRVEGMRKYHARLKRKDASPGPRSGSIRSACGRYERRAGSSGRLCRRSGHRRQASTGRCVRPEH